MDELRLSDDVRNLDAEHIPEQGRFSDMSDALFPDGMETQRNHPKCENYKNRSSVFHLLPQVLAKK